MRVNTPEETKTVINSSVGKEIQLRIKVLKERDKRMLDQTLMKSCDILKYQL